MEPPARGWQESHLHGAAPLDLLRVDVGGPWWTVIGLAYDPYISLHILAINRTCVVGKIPAILKFRGGLSWLWLELADI